MSLLSKLPQIKTEVVWIARTPEGQLFAQTKSITNYVEQCELWEGEGNLIHYKYTTRSIRFPTKYKRFRVKSMEK
jgi:hypothetical protein